jgi:anti-sigma factor RsiW
MMTHEHKCNQYLPGLSDFIDGELSPELCIELERHLAECERCRVVVNTTRKTIELYQSNQDINETPADVKERLYKRLNLEDFLVQLDETPPDDH